MSKKNKSTNSIYEITRKIRGDWGSVNPITKIIPNKKKNYIPDEYDEFYSIDDCNYDLEHHKADLYKEDWSNYQ